MAYGDRCLVHNAELHYDFRSGFDVCYECDREAVDIRAAESARKKLRDEQAEEAIAARTVNAAQ